MAKRDDDTPVTGLVRNKFQSQSEYTGCPAAQRQPEQCSLANGGLNVLMLKMSTLDDGQKKIYTSIEKMSEALYDPDGGLFMKIKDVENKVEKTTKMTEDHITSSATKEQELQDELEKIKNDVQPVKDILKWREKLNKSAIWIASGLGTTLIGLIGKLLYDYIALKHGLPK